MYQKVEWPTRFPEFLGDHREELLRTLIEVDGYLCLDATGKLPHQHSVNFVRVEPITYAKQ